MKRNHRIFIAINLPHEIKQQLARYQEKWQDLPARWTNTENLHLTLVFLGDVSDEELGEVCMAAKEVSQKHAIFDLNFTSITYGPDDKMPPKMVWLHGEKSKEASLLKKDLEDVIAQKINFKPEKRGFSSHITLARIKQVEFRYINPEERPEVNENVDFNFTVESVEVMESVLKRTGPEYEIVESFELKSL